MLLCVAAGGATTGILFINHAQLAQSSSDDVQLAEGVMTPHGGASHATAADLDSMQDSFVGECFASILA